MSPDEVCAALPGVQRRDIRRIEPIKHGLTNESWLIHTSDAAFVVRLSNVAEASLQIDRQSEAVILDVVARAGIAPEVLRCDPAQHLLVTRYAGEVWTQEQATQDGGIDAIARLLRQLHRIPVPAGAQSVELVSVTEHYLQTLTLHGTAGSVLHPASQRRALEAAAILQRESTTCLCHNDVHALNLVDDGALRLIDWEYAGRGLPLFDLASVCVYHRYDQFQRERLLASYADSVTPALWQQLELSCWLFDYVRELWLAVRALPVADAQAAGLTGKNQGLDQTNR